jgi:hypothetical protein
LGDLDGRRRLALDSRGRFRLGGSWHGSFESAGGGSESAPRDAQAAGENAGSPQLSRDHLYLVVVQCNSSLKQLALPRYGSVRRGSVSTN